MLSRRLLSLALVTGGLAAALVAGPEVGPRDLLAAIQPIPGIAFTKLEPAKPRPSRIKRRSTLTHNFHRLKSIRNHRSRARSAAAVIGAYQRQIGQDDVAYQNVTTANAYGTQYAIWANVGGSDMLLTIYTGSADTWVIKDGFECVDYTGTEVDRGTCGFGPRYTGDYQYGLVEGIHMFVKYGDGELVLGDMGYSDVSLANITVKKQQISLANETFWYGDNVTSGMLGLAYPSMVNAYAGEWYEHEPYDLQPYPPIFTNMWQQGLVEPSFTLAIERNSTGGIIGWGGVPAVLTGLDYTTVTYADIIIVTYSSHRRQQRTDSFPPFLQANLNDNPYAGTQPSFYTIIPDGVQYGMVTDEDKFPYIIDSGTSINYFPQRRPSPPS